MVSLEEQNMEGSQSDPSPEWTAPVPGTGLEERGWHSGEGESEYPERPDEFDCLYYLRTGYCPYGSRCPFNHPRDGSAVAISTGREESSSGPQNHDASSGTDGSKIGVKFLVANFIVELMSVVFDQLSSQYKPFLLLCLIMSISAVLISISELVYKLIKERDFWKGVTNWRSLLFDPPPGVPVGFFPCIIALTCAFGQFIITTVSYSLYHKDGNAPLNLSISSTIFAFGQLFSSLLSMRAKTELEPEHKFESYLELESYHFEFESGRELRVNMDVEEIMSMPRSNVEEIRCSYHFTPCSRNWVDLDFISLFWHRSVPRPLPLPPPLSASACASMLIKRSRPKPKSAKLKGD